jgi:hypothetical protein
MSGVLVRTANRNGLVCRLVTSGAGLALPLPENELAWFATVVFRSRANLSF